MRVDKGNATVLMERKEYDEKIEGLLNTNTYKQLKKDPTAAQEAKVGRVLRRFVRRKEISDVLYERLRPSGSLPPRIYGLPKIHKDGVPLRPIVSCIKSPTYQLAKHIAQLISPLAGSTGKIATPSKYLNSFSAILCCLDTFIRE